MQQENFFLTGNARFPFTLVKIEEEEWETITNDELEVYDLRTKKITLAEFKQHKDLLMNSEWVIQKSTHIPDDTELLISYILPIKNEPFLGIEVEVNNDLGEEQKEEASEYAQKLNEHLTEMNDKKFHAQYFHMMYLGGVEKSSLDFMEKDFWEMSAEDQLSHLTFFNYLIVQQNKYPFGEDAGNYIMFSGLPDSDSSKGGYLVIGAW